MYGMLNLGKKKASGKGFEGDVLKHLKLFSSMLSFLNDCNTRRSIQQNILNVKHLPLCMAS